MTVPRLIKDTRKKLNRKNSVNNNQLELEGNRLTHYIARLHALTHEQETADGQHFYAHLFE